ncbi:hypothetical protein [Entomospira culicis]|uniref:Flagellar FliJ protein n=1 Tax=Entomospira culicis TaxID=2719989 RepID=A0A968KWW8_9SPIO|nr:hypothetical protein [Entomospira culicis]NIZ19383.1 hypothetical protein [Entomospira culicis]NIZ69712.1 hypothetical protein [Entomospira culicis]WDI36823.1 hypothetical protein PVA46_05720 [Entomospira culicis]WDI38452.1 hypothetical protein PVA47_05730 [Entomospira culicis]
MKQFHFSLEQLLKYRRDMAESARLSLAGKVGMINLLEHEVSDSLVQERENFVASRKAFDVHHLRQSEYFSAFQEERRAQAERKIQRLAVEREELQQLYQERLKAELVLEHLKEDAYKKYRKKAQRSDQIRLDDMINSLIHADKESVKRNSGEENGRIW